MNTTLSERTDVVPGRGIGNSQVRSPLAELNNTARDVSPAEQGPSGKEA